MSEFVEGPDPENPGDPGISPEEMDALVERIGDTLRKIGLYDSHIAVMVPGDNEDLRKYGVRSQTDDPNPIILMASLQIGDLAWKRVKTEDEKMREDFLRIEQGLTDQTMDEIRKKYENPDE